MHSTPHVFLKLGRARPFFGRHPWVFSGSMERIEGGANDGDEVCLYDHKGQFIARGLYNSQSQIRVRLYSWEEGGHLDAPFWQARLDAAIRLRKNILYTESTSAVGALRGRLHPALPVEACPPLAEGDPPKAGAALAPISAERLVFSESDGLSGLILDRYADFLVLEFTSLAMAKRKEMIVQHLEKTFPCRGIYLRNEKGMAEREGLKIMEGVLWGEAPPLPLRIREGGLDFHVDIISGQKTGFYLDQRENRLALAPMAKGRRVLDLCCYTGAFSLHMARCGATEVVGTDVSETAVCQAQNHAALNHLDQAHFEAGDVFETLRRLFEEKEKFGLIVLDPPRFTRSAASLAQALEGYIRLNQMALGLLEPDGILITCSCSGLVSRTDFISVLSTVSEKTKRPIQILEQRGAAKDHPVIATCPETDYLKCFVCRVL